MFSKACEHGIKAIIYIATQSLEGNRVKITAVAEHTGTPEAFTAKVLGLLTKHQILRSIKGPFGGFEMDHNQIHNISLSQIVKAVDGDQIFMGCGLGLKECNALKPCPMHNSFVKIRTDLKNMLEKTTVYELAVGIISGESILMR